MNKVFLIHHGVGVGGGLIALLGLVEELKADNDVTVISIKSSSADAYITNTGVKHVVLDTFFYKYIYRILCYSEADYYSVMYYLYLLYCLATSFLNKYIFAPRTLKKVIKADDCLLYLNSTFLNDWAYSGFKQTNRVIIHVREPFKNNNSIFSNFILRNIELYVTKIVGISNDNLKRVGMFSKSELVYDPVVINRLNVQEDYFKFDPHVCYFTYLGGSSRIKGFEQLANSLELIDSNVKILVLGSVKQRGYLSLICSFLVRGSYVFRERILISKILQSSKVEIIGLVDNVFFYMNNSKALISPFAKPHASLPTLEAMSVGLPIIASDIPGSEELVQNSANGYIFKNGDSQDLALKINRVSKLDSKELAFMGKKSLQKYQTLMGTCNNVSHIVSEVSIKAN